MLWSDLDLSAERQMGGLLRVCAKGRHSTGQARIFAERGVSVTGGRLSPLRGRPLGLGQAHTDRAPACLRDFQDRLK